MNDSNNQEGVLLTTSGEPQKATEINAFLIITKVLSCFIGIPLNVFVAIIIIRLRRLHSKPRNIFFLGIIFSNLLTFVPALIEVIYWVLPLDIVCQSYVAVSALPNTLLLWNMLLALIDRYVAIKYPIWHREKVTVRRVIYFLLFSSVFLGFLIKFVYIFGLIQLRCTVWTVHSKVVGLTMAILFVLCVIAHFIVFQQTKTLLQKNRTLCPSTKESIGMQTFSNRKRRFSGEDNNQENVFSEGEINEREGDVDRMDYLSRDSFYSGVSEGVIGYDRILKMLVVHEGQLMVEEKGIYSVEKFLVARRQMYWQVYLHKTVLSAEKMMVKILERVRALYSKEDPMLQTLSMLDYLLGEFTGEMDRESLEKFCAIDDHDVMHAIKRWSQHPDPILALLCRRFLDRKLYKSRIQAEPFEPDFIREKQIEAMNRFGVTEAEIPYFCFTGEATNTLYQTRDERINILFKDGSVTDISRIDNALIHQNLSAPVKKFYICSLT